MQENKEPFLWHALDKRNKSYTVKVLHFFHFRRNRIGQSWKREEVLTWELIRALDILPREHFLKNLLLLIRENNPSSKIVIGSLTKGINKIEIEEYPNLGLKGNKRNSASDIGLKLDKVNLWFEAKTSLIDSKALHQQIETQRKALSNKYPNSTNYLIALIPKNQKSEDSFICWEDIAECFTKSVQKLKRDYNNSPIIGGYVKITEELVNRISVLNL